ncbi:MAG: hypothetical protein JWL95_2179 [Gemmatimonadetes bacterium]|nr:hypothetical protein [Gemmatimonadota bacterium]
MMWKNFIRLGLASTIALVAAGCADSPTTGVASPSLNTSQSGLLAQAHDAVVYDQVDFLGNPLVSEVTITKANHDAYNKTQPYNTATFLPQTAKFVTDFNRPPELASLLGSVLYPDILIVDASKAPATAGWLSWALASGWGGRKLTDDVVDIGLSAIFSDLLNPTNAYCKPFQLPLCTDNVGMNDKAFSPTFPYLAAPST